MKYTLMQELVRNWKKDDDVYEFLYNCSSDDFSNHPKSLHRYAVIEALLTHYSTHSRTTDLLHDRAINDPDEQLREWAQEQLQRIESQGGSS